jgi:antitoxin component of MazEF toxin-antitoxin module
MGERIAKGIEIRSDAKIIQMGGSWGIILPFDFIKSMGITEPTPCRIFRNQNDQLIIEINENKTS